MRLSRDSAMRERARGAGGLPVVLLVLFLLLGAAAWFWLSYVPRERAAALDSWSRDLGLRADIRKVALERYFVDSFADAATLTSYPSALRAMTSEATSLTDQPVSGDVERAYLQILLDGFARTNDVLGVVLWDAAARSVAKSRDLVLDDACAGLARDVLASGRPAAGFHLHAGLGSMLTFAVPVRLADGRAGGVAVV